MRKRNGIAVVLSVCLVFTMSAFYGFADDADKPVDGGNEIVSTIDTTSGASNIEAHGALQDTDNADDSVNANDSVVTEQTSDTTSNDSGDDFGNQSNNSDQPGDKINDSIPEESTSANDTDDKLPENGGNNNSLTTIPDLAEKSEEGSINEEKPRNATSENEPSNDEMVMRPLATPKEIPLIISNMILKLNGGVLNPDEGPFEIGNGDRFEMSLDWAVDYDSLPENDPYIYAGDYAYVGVIANMPIQSGTITQKLMMGQTVIGTITLNPPKEDGSGVDVGMFKIVFNENMKDLLGVNGKINAVTVIEYTETPGESIIEDPYEEDVEYDFIFKPGESDLANISKRNTSYESSGGTLDKNNWQIDINTKFAKELGTKITDKLIFADGGGNYLHHEFDKSSIAIRPLIYDGSSWSHGAPLTEGPDYSIEFFDSDNDGIEDSYTITLHGDYPLYEKAYSVSYSTIPDKDANADINSTTYKNIASLENGSSSTAVFEWNTNIHNSKSGQYVQDPYGNDYIIWTVYINRYNSVISDPISVSDVLGAGLGQAYDFVLCETDGGNVVWNNIWSTPPNAYVDNFLNDHTGFSMDLKGGVNPNTGKYYGYRMQYKTPVTGFDNESFNNTLIVNEDEKEGIVPMPGGKGASLSKNFDRITKETVGNEPGIMRWTSAFAAYNNETKGLTLTDTFSFKYGDTSVSGNGLKMALINDDSFVIKLNGTAMVNVGSTAFSSPSAAEYRIEDYGEGGFKVVFNPDYDFRNTVINLEYFTNYWLPKIDSDTGQSIWDSITYVNTIKADFDGNYKELIAEDQTTLGPSTLNNGSKEGLFGSGEEGGTITWTIFANSNKIDLTKEGLSLVDKFPEPIEEETADGTILSNRVQYVADSIEVYRVGAGDGGADQLLTIESDYSFALIGNDDTQGFTLKVLNPGAYEYKFVYKTKLYGNQKNNTVNQSDGNKAIATYKNVVKINNWREIEATVVKSHGKIIDKTGKISDSSEDNMLLDWEIVLNKAKAKLVGVSITDTISKGQVLVSDVNPSDGISNDNIKIYRGDAPLADESNLIFPTYYIVDIDDTSSATGETVLKITFTDDYDFDDTHVIKYQTYVDESTIGDSNPDGSYTLNNHVLLKGGQVTYDEDSSEVINKWTLISGSGKGEIIGLRIKKVAEENPDLVLEGAEFTIEKVGDDTFEPLIVTSGVDGFTEIKFLRIGEYTVTEVKSPHGYALAKEKVKNITLSIKNLDDESTDENRIITVTFENPRAIIACEVDKDTIQRTSAAYISLPGQEEFHNVGNEQYRYNIDFRSTSNVDAEQFWVDDPLENVRLNQVRVDTIWTPIVWGDVDGKFTVYYKTKNNENLRVWPGCLDLDTSVRHKLIAPDGDLVTFVRYDYGEVLVGFTSKNGASESINGEHRDNNGNLNLPSDNAHVIEPLSSLDKGWIMGSYASRVLGQSDISTYATGIGPEGIIDWTPDPKLHHFAQGALEAEGLKPVSYLVTALRQMEGEDIVSSASSHIRLGEMQDQDQDGVVTREIVTFEADPQYVDIDGLMRGDVTEDDVKIEDVVKKGGREKVGTQNASVSKGVQTGDPFRIAMFLLVILSAIGVIVVIGSSYLQKGKISARKKSE